VGSKSQLIYEIEKNLENLKKRILEKNENLTSINKTNVKPSTTRLRYNLDYINILKPDLYDSSSDDSSKSSQTSSSSDSDDFTPQILKANKSTHSLSHSITRNPKTSDFLREPDEESVRNIMENFGMNGKI
jgi:hypothetical protein